MRGPLVRPPVSAGVVISYKCASECRHCLCACCPSWSADWISERAAERALSWLARGIQPSPSGPEGIGINHGLHITGGEPFLNLDILLKLARMARDLGIPSTFVETNCFWASDDNETRSRLLQLREAGLRGVLVGHIAPRTNEFRELGPREFYRHLVCCSWRRP